MNDSSDLAPIRLGFSTCPNDTFMFHGLVFGSGDYEPRLEDIESLNLRVVDDDDAPEVTKVSVAALGHVTDRYTVLRAGAALGRGVGPLVVVSEDDDELATLGNLDDAEVGIPGQYTTAHLLLRIFGPGRLRTRILRFDKIMPDVTAGRLDAGLIIHESRFTYRDHGLRAIADLGGRWENHTGLPLPLGVIVARRDLGESRICEIEDALSASIQAARADPRAAWPWIREHAQEMDEAVCRKHIDLYVNDYSVDLGDEGRAAIDRMLAEGRRSGLLPDDMPSPWRDH